MMTIPPDLENLKPAEAAAILRIGTRALRRLDPKLKPFYINSRVKRYSLAKLQGFMNGGDKQ